MIVNTNIASMNAQKSLTVTNNAMQKSLEKLSSGSRINRAADDAAGLAISEKMRGQIKGLNQAIRNAQSAISLIQTAEGALNETHSILQRMRELAIQSANDTNTNDDRAKIQDEIDQLAKEISRISNTTEFNTQNLLAGALNNVYHIGANAGQNISLTVGAVDAFTLGVAGSQVTTTLSNNVFNFNISTVSEEVNGLYVNVKKTAAAVTEGISQFAGAVTVGGSYDGSADQTFVIRAETVDGGTGEVTQISVSTDGGSTFGPVIDVSGGVFDIGSGITVEIATDAGNAAGNLLFLNASAERLTFKLNSADDGTGTDYGTEAVAFNNATSVVIGGATTQVRLEFDSFADVFAAAAVAYGAGSSEQISQTFLASTAATFNPDGSINQEAITRAGINVSSQAYASNAITIIDIAINKVSQERGKLGAYQNRLEHTINNLQTASENMSSAESRIRDVDMAAEMSNFTKNQILSQAGVAMLAQANQVPQAVLKLLG